MVQKCHLCQIFSKKICVNPPLLHPLVVFSHFTKCRIDFMTCRPTSVIGNNYIIMAIDYFTKWVEPMSTYSNNMQTTPLSMFNHIIIRFSIPMEIVTDHGSHFCNKMIYELNSLLKFGKENSSCYYQQNTGQVGSINHVLKKSN